ncbi:hypothetical protein CsSME_00022296 [Camellia sinensis var. sinensis]
MWKLLEAHLVHHSTFCSRYRDAYIYICSNLVKVSKLSQLSKLARDNNTASKTIEADSLHTMFLAMADARAVLIKLADRLHNMMTLDALPLVKQQRFAKETLEIFSPLANRLGISSWKEKLENLCFKYLYPDEHKELSSNLMKSFDEAMVASAVEKLEQVLEDAAISYHDLSGRHKSLYSIYVKMMKKKLTMDEIHDIHGLRLIVEKEEDCHKALRVVHQLWSAVPGKYQSLHTVVMGEGMVPLEVQIRMKDMHLQAEFGFAAHWRYKEDGQRKVEVHGSPTPTAHSAIGGGGSGGGGGHSSPTPVTKRPMLSYSALNRRSAVCKTTATYSSCLRGPNGSRRPNGSRLSPPH